MLANKRFVDITLFMVNTETAYILNTQQSHNSHTTVSYQSHNVIPTGTACHREMTGKKYGEKGEE